MSLALARVTEVGAEEIFLRLREFARRPAVVGIVVAGSRGKGFGAPDSDVDAYVVFDDAAPDAELADAAALGCDRLDLSALREGAFARLAGWGEPEEWDRYDFAHVRPLVDPHDRLLPLVVAKGNLPAAVAGDVAEGALDAFLNAAWRCEKAEGRGDRLAARLQCIAAVQPLLTFLFAAEGRLVPWPDYLERELAAFPLGRCPLEGQALATALVALADGQGDVRRSLVGSLIACARSTGFAAIVDRWQPSQLARMQSSAVPTTQEGRGRRVRRGVPGDRGRGWS